MTTPENMRRLLMQAPVAIAILKGPELVFALVNPHCENLMGKTEASLLGASALDALPGTPEEILAAYCSQAWQQNETVTLERFPSSIASPEIDSPLTIQPIRNDEGAVTELMIHAGESTAAKKVQAIETNVQNLLNQTPVGIAVYKGENLEIELVNKTMLQYWGRTADQALGTPLWDLLPEAKEQGLDKIAETVLTSGLPFNIPEAPVTLLRNGQMETFYASFGFQPRFDEAGRIVGLLGVANDVTAQVEARRKVEESEQQMRSVVDSMPFPVSVHTGADMKIVYANQNMIGAWGKGRNVLGRPLQEVMPEMSQEEVYDKMDAVYRTGIPYHNRNQRMDLWIDGELKRFYYNYSFSPLLNAEGKVYGVLNTAADVTDANVARLQLAESELFARSIFDHSPIAKVVFTGNDMVIKSVNQNMFSMLGRDESIIGMPFMEAVPELATTPLLSRLQQVLATGETYYQPEEKIMLIKQGEPYVGYYNYVYKALPDTFGHYYGVMVTATEVTDLVAGRKQIEEAQASLADAIELAQLGTWSVDLVNRTMEYSDRLRQWFGFEADEPLTVEKGYECISEEDHPRILAAMQAATATGSDQDYDIEYTIINRHTGQERIIHAQGRAEFDENGVVIRVSGTAQDITEQRRTRLALEQQVQQRTEELAAANEELSASNEELATTNEELAEANKQLIYSNEELAQYAYVASHDLQEPLRKIRMFSSMLNAQTLPEPEGKSLVSKIGQSAERMHLLIRDLLEFSRLLNSEGLMRPVDLSTVMKAVVDDFELTIKDKGAKLEIEELPVVDGVSLQLNQLFYNLLSNALKFTDPARAPHITISAQLLSKEDTIQYFSKSSPLSNYYRISFADNGIGFESQYFEQIFEVFKRLHGRDLYPGSGIGLSICRRVVANHRGFLKVESEPGKGSTFHIILPDRQ